MRVLRRPRPDSACPGGVQLAAVVRARNILLSPIALSAAACAAVAAVLGREVLEGETRRVDAAILGAIHAHTTPLLHAAATFASFMGGLGVVAVALALVVLLFARGERRTAVTFALGIVVAQLLDMLLKELFGRVRPELWLRPSVLGESFPSGHALASTVIYGLVAWTLARRYPRHSAAIGASAAFVVAAIALSRLVLGVHWPSDVVAGMAIGYLCLSVLVALTTPR